MSSLDSNAKQGLPAVLTKMVSAVNEDHAQLRKLIYEFARIKLRRSLYREFEEGDWTGIQERVLALESAIEEVEADFSNKALPAPAAPENEAPAESLEKPAYASSSLRPIMQHELILGNYSAPPSFLRQAPYDIEQIQTIVTVPERDDRSTIVRKLLESKTGWTIQMIVAVILGVAIYSLIDSNSAVGWLDSHRFLHAAVATDHAENGKPAVDKVVAHPGIPGIPDPTSYGVYAVSNGQLTPLDLLPIRVPDPRVAMSAAITAPSSSHLPVGPLQFVVYRRGLANDAPDRVLVRVVAQVVRALTFNNGGAATFTKVDQTWVVRGNSYQMSVAPVPDNPEMIVIRPENVAMAFPAGRYALTLKWGAYDFTVDGPIRDKAHCLERTDALGTPVYSECRNP